MSFSPYRSAACLLVLILLAAGLGALGGAYYATALARSSALQTLPAIQVNTETKADRTVDMRTCGVSLCEVQWLFWLPGMQEPDPLWCFVRIEDVMANDGGFWCEHRTAGELD